MNFCKYPNDDIRVFEEAMRALEIEAMNFARRFTSDAKVRIEYGVKTQVLSQEYLLKIQRGMSPYQAATEVNLLRNEILNLMRLRTSDVGRAWAENKKKTGRTLVDLCERYAQKFYKRDFAKLTNAQRDKVYREIIKASGRTLPSANLTMQRLSRVGRGLFVLSLGIAVYNVATSDDKVRAAGNEGVVIGGGILGGAMGGGAAGLACGPGAPVCVTIGVFVGGLLGGFGSDITFDHFFNQ